MSAPTIETRSWVAGEYITGSGTPFTLLNPSTGDKVADLTSASKEDIDRAVAAAQAAQPAWAKRPATDRAAALNKLADLIDQHAAKLNELDGLAMGQVAKDAPIHASISSAKLRFAAGLANTVTGDTSLLSPGQLNMVVRQPYGVVGAIIPWNVPLVMLVAKVGPATAAGNAIILKSSEKAPLACAFVAALTKEAGFPDGIINIVVGLGETGKYIAEHMDIRKISFTGSTRTGRFIASAAAMSNLKSVALELGGKSPTIVFEDADLAKAIPALGFSLMWNSGQICMATTRIYVHEKIADEFKKQYTAFVGSYKPGNSRDPNTNLGPLADKVQHEAVKKFLEVGRQEGKALIGGNAVDGPGMFVEPTVYDDLKEDSLLNKNEIFGPVVLIHTFTDEKEALRQANDSDYGLYASVFTRDADRAVRVAKALEAGTVGINCTSPSGAAQVPFGGFKSSGLGREGGLMDVKNWTEEKSLIWSFSDY